VKRLSASDAMLLYQERSRYDYTHSIRITLVEPPAGVGAAQVREALLRVVSQFPLLTWRIARTPFGLHHPLWVTDPALDFREHVYRVGCPAPGTDREFAQLVSDFASRPLDRTRPLWESWVVDGLQSGHIAIITKIHHALADGVATAHLFEQVYSGEPVPFDQLPEIKRYPAPPTPSLGKRTRLALVDVVTGVPKAALMLFKRRAEVRNLLAQRDDGPEPARGFDQKTTALNAPGESHRQFAVLSLPLAEMKSVGAAFGATINDVFLAVCAGAVRRFLLERGQLPDFPLVAGVPVSTREPNEQVQHGNRVSLLQIRLATDIQDPVERLLAIKADAKVAKDHFQATIGARPEDALEILPPAVHKLLVHAMKMAVGKGRAVAGHVALSNVPGPRKPLYLAESRVSAIYGVGPILGGVGLNITAWSYLDQMNLSLLSGRRTFPDLWPLTAMVNDAFEELRNEALLRAG
jgi:WS/DGAT/MGAT family acyltransferase